jgi:hypothetical protein
MEICILNSPPGLMMMTMMTVHVLLTLLQLVAKKPLVYISVFRLESLAMYALITTCLPTQQILDVICIDLSDRSENQ